MAVVESSENTSDNGLYLGVGERAVCGDICFEVLGVVVEYDVEVVIDYMQIIPL